MGRLAIRKVQYVGDKYSFESPDLPDGLVVIEGPNGSGKTTFSDLIYFGLGGYIEQFKANSHKKHHEISADTNNAVVLTVELEGLTYQIRRSFKLSDDIIVSQPNIEGTKLFQVRRTGKNDRDVFSDWLLKQLGFEPVTIYSGNTHGKINFTDLARLIYHDQEPDPRRVFKSVDRDNRITDSIEFRRAIVQILFGQSSEEFYKISAEVKTTEEHLVAKRHEVQFFRSLVSRQNPDLVDANVENVENELSLSEATLEGLIQKQESLRNEAPFRPSSGKELADYRQDLVASQTFLAELEAEQRALFSELWRLRQTNDELGEDAERIAKIIHAHDALQLFSPDTCPCCLRKVDRKTGECICQQSIDENSYQRYFYTPDDYIKLLKSKQKSKITVEDTIQARELEKQKVTERMKDTERRLEKIQQALREWSSQNSGGHYTTELQRVDDQIIETRLAVDNLRRHLVIAQDREKLEKEASELHSKLDELKTQKGILEGLLKVAIAKSIATFSTKYEALLKPSLEGVFSVWLDSEADYQPIINGGEYREASSGVVRRLMYYLTMLSMSLREPRIPFPRFLLIDTPATAGIDSKNMIVAIEKISHVLKEGLPAQGQVILTTGPEMYPQSMRAQCVVTLSMTAKLLHRTHSPNPVVT